jgi:hypothetical protein
MISRDVTNSEGRKAECASACVFIIASAVHRFVFCHNLCDIIVHNPFMTSSRLSYGEIESNMSRIKNQAIRQFKRVGVSEKLWEIMASTPSEHSRNLTEQEARNLGLLFNQNPILSDYQAGVVARMNGHTKSDYLQRKHMVNLCSEESVSNATRNNAPQAVTDKILKDCNRKYGLWSAPYDK